METHAPSVARTVAVRPVNLPRTRSPTRIVRAVDAGTDSLDTVRSWNLSLYGYARPTSPELDRFAARGVVFDRAIAPSSWTLTTHLSAFSGLMPSEMTGLGISPLTVKNHVQSILRKLGVANRTQAVATALNLGLLSHDA